MSSKINKQNKLQDRIKELEVENARLCKENKQLLEWYREEVEEREEFNKMYKGG